MLTRRSLGWPITLGVVMIVLLVALTVGWVLVVVVAANRTSSSGYWWAILAVGTTFLVLVLVGVVLYLVLTIKEIRLNQRQSNFIDSVTHELKSPLASLKLYVQTLSRRNVTESQQADFLSIHARRPAAARFVDQSYARHGPAESGPPGRRDDRRRTVGRPARLRQDGLHALPPAGRNDHTGRAAGPDQGPAGRRRNRVSQLDRQRSEVFWTRSRR